MKLDEERQKYNLKILDLIRKYILTYPQLRFNQTLENLGIVQCDTFDFYEESEDTYNKLVKEMEKYENRFR